jgi:hypothetical protein
MKWFCYSSDWLTINFHSTVAGRRIEAPSSPVQGVYPSTKGDPQNSRTMVDLPTLYNKDSDPTYEQVLAGFWQTTLAT